MLNDNFLQTFLLWTLFSSFTWYHELPCDSQGPCGLGQTSVWLTVVTPSGLILRYSLHCVSSLLASLQEHGHIQDIRRSVIVSYFLSPAELKKNSLPQSTQKTSTLFGLTHEVMAHRGVGGFPNSSICWTRPKDVCDHCLLNSESACDKVADGGGGHGEAQKQKL